MPRVAALQAPFMAAWLGYWSHVMDVAGVNDGFTATELEGGVGGHPVKPVGGRFKADKGLTWNLLAHGVV